MQASGILFMAKTKPLAQPAADGTFVITLLAVDRIGAHQVEPWRVTYAGPEAKAFWDAHGAQLVPGQPINVLATRMRTYTIGRGGAAEVHAVLTQISLAPTSTGRSLLPNSEQATA